MGQIWEISIPSSILFFHNLSSREDEGKRDQSKASPTFPVRLGLELINSEFRIRRMYLEFPLFRLEKNNAFFPFSVPPF